MKQNTINPVVTALMGTLETAEILAPSGTNLADVIGATDAGRTYLGQYGEDPIEEFRLRLATYDRTREHQPRLRELTGLLGTRTVWDIACTTENPSRAISRLLSDGILSDDTTMLIDGLGHPEVLEDIVYQRVSRTPENFDARTVGRWLIDRGVSAQKLLDVLGCFVGLDDDVVDRAVAHLSETDRFATYLSSFRYRFERFTLSGEQVARLIGQGTPASCLVALRLGAISRDLQPVAYANPIVLALEASGELWSKTFTEAVEQRLALLPVDLINDAAAHRIVANVHVGDQDLLATLITRSGAIRNWLSGHLNHNLPDLDTFVLLTTPGPDGSAPAISGAEVFHTLATTRLRHHGEAFTDALTCVPGLTAELFDRLAEDGDRPNQVSSWHAGLNTAALKAMTSVLGDDQRLWDRFVNAEPRSPFRDPNLSIREICEVYRARWTAAAARRQGLPAHA